MSSAPASTGARPTAGGEAKSSRAIPTNETVARSLPAGQEEPEPGAGQLPGRLHHPRW